MCVYTFSVPIRISVVTRILYLAYGHAFAHARTHASGIEDVYTHVRICMRATNTRVQKMHTVM